LIFMDIHMPLMDGIEAAKKMHELGVKVPIIAMTANIMPHDVRTYLESGMDECLSKPFLSNELWSCLLRYLEPVQWQDDTIQKSESLDPDSLFNDLEELLKESNIDCLSLTYQLQSIPGSERIIEQIREFDFKHALDTLKTLRQNLKGE